MDKLIITVTCDSTMSFPRNPHNPTPKGIGAVADEYVRSVEAGAAICHLHGPYTVDEKVRADGTKLSDLDIPGWGRLRQADRRPLPADHPVRHRQRPLPAAEAPPPGAAARHGLGLP